MVAPGLSRLLPPTLLQRPSSAFAASRNVRPAGLHSPRPLRVMLTFLRGRTRAQLIILALVAGTAVAAISVAVMRPRSQPAPLRNQGVSGPVQTPSIAAPHPTSTLPPLVASTTQVPSSSAPAVAQLPGTSSADVYATEAAKALWTIDYASTNRESVLTFWRAQLATVLPAGTPPGTTLAAAQDAAMSTLTDLLPTSAVWSSLARDHTVSTFTVTGVSEPPSWVEAVSSGKIADPGLTAREVVGVQKISYGTGTAVRTTAQTQQLVIALLCPPTTVSCRVEVFPPSDTSGTSG